jgi:AraC-like DNA-binding protein
MNEDKLRWAAMYDAWASEQEAVSDEMLKLTFIRPRVELRSYVRACWVLESANGLPSAENNIVAPGGRSALVMPLDGSIETTRDSHTVQAQNDSLYFFGTQDCPALVRTAQTKVRAVVIEFQTCGAYPLFGTPMGDTLNGVIVADDIFGRWGAETRARMCDAAGAAEKLNVLQNQLVRLTGYRERSAMVHYCVKTLATTSGSTTVRQLELETGLTQRYLHKLFQDQVGLSPKVLAGIYRFQTFYQKWAAGCAYEEIKDDLYDHYYDQAHFAKEFKRMAGASPKQYFTHTTNHLGRLVTRHLIRRRHDL